MYDWDESDNYDLYEKEANIIQPWYLEKDSVTSLVVGEGITSIGEFAFEDLTNLKDVQLPLTLETICYGAFYGCTGLMSVNLPINLKRIEMWAFNGCGIKELIISKNLEELQVGALCGNYPGDFKTVYFQGDKPYFISDAGNISEDDIEFYDVFFKSNITRVYYPKNNNTWDSFVKLCKKYVTRITFISYNP